MGRNTIDFGIDLGTTNSAIAVLKESGPEVIKNNENQDITPSAVHISKKGEGRVGLRARNRLEDERSASDVYIEFKRRMGTKHVYRFQNSGLDKRPEELSAETLKSLCGDARTATGEVLQSAVITVPAAFEQRQCAATRSAGELAGLLQCPLLQEPVAASLAYGFQDLGASGYWLVYDFGGGTFDAALMKADDGTISVVNHGGDNYLGGSDIDKALLDSIVMPRLREEYRIPGTFDGDDIWKARLARIKHRVELGKIDLSRQKQVAIEIEGFEDLDGNEVEMDLELRYDDLVGVAEPIIMRSVDICKRMLEEKNLAPSAISKVILVGGPTLAPYFREILKSELGVPLDFSIDPMTVVARGAAVFAGTQLLDAKSKPKAKAGTFSIDLKYNPIGPDEDPTVRGTVSASDSVDLSQFSIEFINENSHWQGGKVALKSKGNFKVSLLAEPGQQNRFRIELTDAQGHVQKTDPDSLVYTIGMAVSEQTIMNNIAVAQANNEPKIYFKKGESLPAKKMHVLRTAHAIKKGSNDSIRIPVVEGNAERADRNKLLGTLTIKGESIRRDLPANAEAEVTLNYDESRMLLVKAYFPVLDEEYEMQIKYDNCDPDPCRLMEELKVEESRIEKLLDSNADDGAATEVLEQIEEKEKMEEVRALLEHAQTDPDSANKAERRLLELKLQLDEVENLLDWPSKVAEAREGLAYAKQAVEEVGDAEHRRQLVRIEEEAEELIAQKRAQALVRKVEEGFDVMRDCLHNLPDFWVGFFQHLESERGKMVDEVAAARLFHQGNAYIEQGNLQGLRSVVVQLLQLLPQEEAARIQRGYKSGVIG